MKLIVKKKIGKLGRLGIPEQIREDLGMQPGEEVQLFTDGTRLVVQTAGGEDRCALCGSPNNLSEFKGRMLCKQCRHEILEDEIDGLKTGRHG